MKALLFPGQGSQYVGMGFSVAKRHATFQGILDRYLSEADRVLGFSLSRLIETGPDEKLAETAITQPAIFAVSVAYLDFARETGLADAVGGVAGHSLGEYSALFAAGCFSFADGIRLVHERGRFMQEAVPVGVGSMGAVVGLSVDVVGELCRACSNENSVVEPAGFNNDGQTVVAGHVQNVNRLLEAARAKGARMVTPLKVSMPSHCSLMRPAAQRLEALLKKVSFQAPSVSYVPNARGAVVAQGAATIDSIKAELVNQLTRPVRWLQAVQSLLSLDVGEFLEVGPGKVLFGFQRKIAPDAKNEFVENLWIKG